MNGVNLDINDFIGIARQNNGKVRFSFQLRHEGNMIRLLRDLGYRKTTLDKRRLYYHRDGKNLRLVRKWEIVTDAFTKLYKAGGFINIPGDIDYFAPLNWYYQKNPIKENGIFDMYLRETLTEAEAHGFRLDLDPDYKRRFEVQELLKKLNEWQFSKVIDAAGSLRKNCTIYYKPLGDQRYLTFIHFKFTDKSPDTFDVFIATFNNENHIGKRQPLRPAEDVRLGFVLSEDYDIVKEYIE